MSSHPCLDLTYDQAASRYPVQAQAALADMTRKFRRAKAERPAPEDMEWSLDWCAGSPLARPTLAEVRATLTCQHGRRRTAIDFAPGHHGQDPRDWLPMDALFFYDNAVDPAHVPHAARFRMRTPNHGVQEVLATGGYRSSDGIAIHYLTVGDPWHPDLAEEDLVDIRGNRASFGGGLRDIARQRYERAAEGEEFTFRTKILTRLRTAEIRAAVEGRTFTWSLF